MPKTSAPRSLTQMLREADDAALTGLLLDRPDLAFPDPGDFSQIASRATTRQSVAAAADLLDGFELWVAQQLGTLQGPVSAASIAAHGVDPTAVGRAMARLRALALAWGSTDALRPVRVLGTVLGDAPAGPAPESDPPSIVVSELLTPTLVDKVAAGSAFEFVRRIDVLVEHCDHQPLRRRRDGGLTTRQVRALGDLLDIPAAVATTYVELAEAAGLLGLSADGADEVILPTDEFDDWQARSLGEQWALLVSTWIDDPRVGAPPWLIRLCLEGLGEPGAGQVVHVDSLRAWIAWQRPRRSQHADRVMRTVLEQATAMGVTALGAPASFGPGADAAGVDMLLPDRTDHVLIQADLTAIAPGPLTVEAAQDLGALADVESRGGATVYRFSVESLRRARSLGWSEAEILQTLEHRSRTPIPQPLSYLVHDVSPVPGTADQGLAGPLGHLPPARAMPQPPASDLTAADRLGPDEAAAVVASLRRADRPPEPVDPIDAVSERRPVSAGAPLGPLAVLREAVETGEPVWFGYIDKAGTRGERLVTARAVEDGVLLADEVRGQGAVRLPVHRITAAHIIRSAP